MGPVNPNDANSIKSAYQGYVGWNDPAAIVADFKATGGQGKGGPTSGGMGLPTAPTPFDLVGATNAAYNTPEITAANQGITSAQTELTTRQQALADAQAQINDNPFYSEATRVGKSAKLTEQANADMAIIQNKVTQAQQQVASLKADA